MFGSRVTARQADTCGTISVVDQPGFDPGQVAIQSCGFATDQVQRGTQSSVAGSHTWANGAEAQAYVQGRALVDGSAVPISVEDVAGSVMQVDGTTYEAWVPSGGSVTANFSVAVADLPTGQSLPVGAEVVTVGRAQGGGS